MENLLNLLWLLVAVVLLLAAIAAERRSQLRCSLAVAIGCTALLALVLFPALSMTDDLQMARFDVESSGRHLSDTLRLGSTHELTLLAFGVSAVLLLLIASGFHKPSSIRFQAVAAEPIGRCSSARPQAVRPPPVFFS